MDLAAKINTIKLKESEIAIFWLGQAGFVIKDHENRVLAIDPYLTDCVEREIGFKRMTPKLISPNELDLDILITSHEHLDHFDIDAVPDIMSNKKTKLIGSYAAIALALKQGLDQSQMTAMKPGDEIETDGIAVKAVVADHGALSPDALGLLITIGGIKIYYAGDTAYTAEVIKTARGLKPDIAIVPINGQYGNLNSAEAARLVRYCGAKVAIPCHFWTFIMHRGDPQEFADAMKKQAPGCQVRFIYQGEMFRYGLQ